MRFDLISYPLVYALFIRLMLLILWFWRVDQSPPAVPKPLRAKRDPKPFAGYTHKPECELCEPGLVPQPPLAGAPPPPNDVHPRPSPTGRDHGPLLPAYRLFLLRLGGWG